MPLYGKNYYLEYLAFFFNLRWWFWNSCGRINMLALIRNSCRKKSVRGKFSCQKRTNQDDIDPNWTKKWTDQSGSYRYKKICVCMCQVASVVPDSLWPWQAGSLPLASPGKPHYYHHSHLYFSTDLNTNKIPRCFTFTLLFKKQKKLKW